MVGNTVSVAVNGNTAYRKGEYFDYALSTPNSGTPWYGSVTVASGSSQSSGHLYVPGSPEAFSYDLDGNLHSDGHWTYTRDAEKRLVQMVSNNSTAPPQLIKFEYDWLGRRIHKQVWNNTTGYGTAAADYHYLYDGWEPIAELSGVNNVVLQAYVWGTDLSGTLQGAGGVGGLLSLFDVNSGSVTWFAAGDRNGNVVGLPNARTGTVDANHEYGPFGELIRATGPTARTNPFRFSTKYQDDESGLLYYGYRHYNPGWPRRSTRWSSWARAGHRVSRHRGPSRVPHKAMLCPGCSRRRRGLWGCSVIGARRARLAEALGLVREHRRLWTSPG